MSEQTPTLPGRLSFGEPAMAGGILALGVFALVRAGSIAEPVTAAGAIGPRTMPYLVGGLLVVTGGITLARVLRGERGEPEGGEDVDLSGTTDWLTAVLLAVAVLGHALLIGLVGWPLAGAALFTAGAVILGARPWWRSLLIGLIMAFAIQLVFAGGLGVSLPPGPFLEGVWFLHG